MMKSIGVPPRSNGAATENSGDRVSIAPEGLRKLQRRGNEGVDYPANLNGFRPVRESSAMPRFLADPTIYSDGGNRLLTHLHSIGQEKF